MKTEPTTFSIDELKHQNVTHWEGVRNYQARNFMRDDMRIGDKVLIYHSNCDTPGIYGLAEITSKPYPDHFSWNEQSKYFDPKSSPKNPRWVMVDVTYRQKWDTPITLSEIKADPQLQDMLVVKRGSRLSIQPVSKEHYHYLIAQRP